jgi:hypothetical protein
MIEPPIDAKIDFATAIVKGAVSNVPLAGGVMAELGNLYLNPLERRKQRWMVEVSTALNLIHERFAMLPADLEQDDRFTSFLYEATTIAIKTHQAAKLDALRNSLAKSVGSSQLNEDIGIQFLRYIDELTPSHLMLLSTLERNSIRYAEFTSLKDVCSTISTEIGSTLDEAAMRTFLQDLDARFLVRLGDLEELPEFATKKSFALREESAIRPIEVTTLGRSFLAFIGT